MKKKTNAYIHGYTDFEDCGLYVGDTGKLACSTAKRMRNIYHLVFDPENMLKAQYNAQKGKGDRKEIKRFNENISDCLDALYWELRDETYMPSRYRIMKIHDPKERDIMIAPFFPDRIVHHCIINVLGQHWLKIFTKNTYSCIKGRGTHKCMLDVRNALMRDRKGTTYCLKTDIRKYYDNVDHAALKRILRYTIADESMLKLLDKIVDSNGIEKGLPIGNYTSQYFANLYLAYFDHWVVEELAPLIKRMFGCKIYYFRYMDDMVFLANDKDALHYVLDMAGLYLGAELKVEFKHNWQVFPVDARGIDFVGFKQTHFGIFLRKSILKRFYKKSVKVAKHNPIRDETDIKHLFPSEYGWVYRCSERHKQSIFKSIIENGNKYFVNRAAV